MNKLHEITKDYLKNDIPDFESGDTVSVNVRVREGNKERVQKYEGVVISRRGGKGLDASFTVRKVTNGVGVERIFPLHSPIISSINVNNMTCKDLTTSRDAIFYAVIKKNISFECF